MSDRNSLSVCTTTSSFKGFFRGLFFLSLHACSSLDCYSSYKLQIRCDVVFEQNEPRNRCRRKLSTFGHAFACFLGQPSLCCTQHVYHTFKESCPTLDEIMS